MRLTIGMRLTAISGVIVGLVMAIGVIGARQAGNVEKQNVVASVVGDSLSETNDAEHAASVALADLYILIRRLTAEQRKAVIEQLQEHTAKLSERIDTMAQTRITAEIDAEVARFVASARTVVDQAEQLARTAGRPAEQLVRSM